VLDSRSRDHLHCANGVAHCGAVWAARTIWLGTHHEQFVGLVLDGGPITGFSLVGFCNGPDGGYPALGLLAVNPLDPSLPQSIHSFSDPVERPKKANAGIDCRQRVCV
jgi:hypothetical protein